MAVVVASAQQRLIVQEDGLLEDGGKGKETVNRAYGIQSLVTHTDYESMGVLVKYMELIRGVAFTT